LPTVGELDAYTVGQFRERLAELAVTSVAHRPSSVPFMDPAGLGASSAAYGA
jgi:anti-anti-sigma regulatory factor